MECVVKTYEGAMVIKSFEYSCCKNFGSFKKVVLNPYNKEVNKERTIEKNRGTRFFRLLCVCESFLTLMSHVSSCSLRESVIHR